MPVIITLKWTPEGLEVISNGQHGGKRAGAGRRKHRVSATRAFRNKERLVAALGVLQAIKESPVKRVTSEQAVKMMGYAHKSGGGLGRFSHMMSRVGKVIGINSRDAFIVSRDPVKHHTYWIAMDRLDEFIEGLEGLTK